MTNSATDHGYNADWTICIRSGLECRIIHCGKTHTYRVTDLDAPEGFRKVIMIDGPFLAQVFNVSERRIREDAYAA